MLLLHSGRSTNAIERATPRRRIDSRPIQERNDAAEQELTKQRTAEALLTRQDYLEDHSSNYPTGTKTTRVVKEQQKKLATRILDDTFLQSGVHNSTKFVKDGMRLNCWSTVRELLCHDEFEGRWAQYRRKERAFARDYAAHLASLEDAE